MIRIIIRRNDGHGIGLVRCRMLRQLDGTSGIGRADMDNDRHSRFCLVEGDSSSLLAFFNRHRRPLAGGAENEQPLNARPDMKVHQSTHHLFVDANPLIKRRNYR
jgi:hypothetical protein